MTRTGSYKAIYAIGFAAAVALLTTGIAAALTGRGAIAAASLAAFAALLVPGRILAWFWRDLLTGLHCLNRRDFQGAKRHSERFLAQLPERPWLRRLIWLGTSSYTRDPEVMALNNLGAAELQLGEMEAARAHLVRAIDLDPNCPLPYRNMGALALRTGPAADALPWFQKAAALGLTGGWSDRWVMGSQRRNAAFSTTGRPQEAADPPVPAASDGAHLVVLLNDDRTPLEFVIPALEKVFGFTGAQAIRIARTAHEQGQAVCAGFETEEEAGRKADEIMALASSAGHTLACAVRHGPER